LNRQFCTQPAAHARLVRLALFFLLGLALTTVCTWPPAAAVAQDGNEASEGGEGAAETSEEQNFVWWVIETSGVIGAVILVLSIYFVYKVVTLFLELRPEVAVPPELDQQCEELLQKRDFQGVYNAVSNDDSFYGRVLTTGIKELPNGLGEARDAMERSGDAVGAEMEKNISMLAVLGTLGPMIGLLGTLMGMINSFGTIARGGQQLKSAEVARGISEALLLTFEGVSLSVPAIFFFAIFRNRISSITTNTMLQADEFLRRFAHTARQKSSPTVAAAKPSS
jgi:biopolymer transport protein ExbB